jgi:hypothetical protein
MARIAVIGAGAIVCLGAEAGVPTPLNAIVVEMVRRVEEHGRFYEVSAIHEAIARGKHNL